MTALTQAAQPLAVRHRVATGRIAAVLVALALPFVLTPYWLNIAVLILFAIIGAQALNLLTGLVGQVSIGNAAFLGIGAMGAVLGNQTLGLGFLPSAALGVVCSALVGGLLAVFAFRLRGFYLVLGTIALHYAVVYGFAKWQYADVGASSFLLDPATFLGTPLVEDRDWYYLLAAVVLIVCWGFANLRRTQFGRTAAMIRDREDASPAFGISPKRVKVAAFVWSSAVIGLQGALFAFYIGTISSDVFTLTLAIQYVAMIVIGGMGEMWGAVIGAAYVVALPFLLADLGSAADDVYLFIYGATVVGFLLWEPAGIVGLVRRLGARLPRHGAGGGGS